MRVRPAHLRVALAFVASIAAHVAILPPLVIAVTRASEAPTLRGANDVLSRLAPPPMDIVRLGIDADTPSSMTWIGYEEYEEHLARLSEFEQPAMTDEAAGSPAPPAEPQPPADTAMQAEPADAAEEAPISPESTESGALESAEPVESPAAPAGEGAPDASPLEATEEPAAVAPIEASPRTAPRFIPLIGPMARPRDDQREAARPITSSTVAPPRSAPGDAPAAPADPGSRGEEPGDPADKEVDPSSFVEVPESNWKAGKPLAARGLELFPRKPVFTVHTRLTALPHNPLCVIFFDRSGAVREAAIVKSSGDQRVDDAIRASLYFWRAKGEQLDAIAEDDVVEVRIRYVLREGRDAV
jgi:hypothetical protein